MSVFWFSGLPVDVLDDDMLGRMVPLYGAPFPAFGVPHVSSALFIVFAWSHFRASRHLRRFVDLALLYGTCSEMALPTDANPRNHGTCEPLDVELKQLLWSFIGVVTGVTQTRPPRLRVNATGKKVQSVLCVCACACALVALAPTTSATAATSSTTTTALTTPLEQLSPAVLLHNDD